MSKYLTPDEYLKAERVSEAKAEYVAGQVLEMQGPSIPHARIVRNIQVALANHMKESPCEALAAGIKVKSEEDKFFYPDVLVFCGEPIYTYGANDVILNPTVIIEVLSRTTSDWDRGGKFEYCRRIETLTDYILVSQDKCQVEHRERQSSTKWTMRFIDGLDGVIRLKTTDCELPLADIYERVITS